MSNKVWQVMPKISENLRKKYPEINQVVLQLLFNRGITKKDEIEKFLNPSNNDLHDPFLFIDMERAVKLIIKHIKAQNKIVIYGDYDADGVTAAALLYEVLEILKAKVDVYIPDRVSEGYGLNKKAIDEITKKGTKLIITVDGGIRNKEEVEQAKIKGVEVVITDHHPPPESKKDYPDCLIIDSLTKREEYPFKKLAGVGVAFKLAIAIVSKSKLSKKDKKKIEEKVLDLVAIGTIADCVSLTGENRILVKRGLDFLNNTKRLGLKELIEVAQIKRENLDAWNVGWQIGPRLNAAGRMEHANTAYELLITKNKGKAEVLARRLNDRNIERQSITEEIVEKIEKQINLKKDDKIIIGVCPKEDEAWNEGVVGLVAGRICEKYYLPTLIITKAEGGYKGSGRSIDEFNLAIAVEDSEELLDKYGGHPAACGFCLEKKNLGKFIERIKKYANKKLAGIDLRPKLEIDSELEFSEINNELVEAIEKFEPFGEGNPRQKFVSRNILIRDVINMGIDSQHVKFRLDNGLWALAFGQAENYKDLKIGDKVDIVYYVEENRFNGKVNLQLKIIDIKNC
ncbi:MAG: single-stranded-DNA-specific exonuclease RecJ [Patescibacteria group bacterium]